MTLINSYRYALSAQSDTIVSWSSKGRVCVAQQVSLAELFRLAAEQWMQPARLTTRKVAACLVITMDQLIAVKFEQPICTYPYLSWRRINTVVLMD